MFKRTLALLVAGITLFSLTACLSYLPSPSENVSTPPLEQNEILFREIPWGTDPNEANKLMGGDLLLSENYYIKDWACAYDVFSPGVCQGGHALIGSVDEVAGYPVFMTTLYFMYPPEAEIDRSIERSEFYLANYQLDVIDVDAAYDDLKNKLNVLYGVGQEEINTVTHSQWSVAGSSYSGRYDTLERCTTWLGGNNTQVVLMCSSLADDVDVLSGNFLLLTYGKTDIDQRLEFLSNAIWKDLQQTEESNRDPENHNGL